MVRRPHVTENGAASQEDPSGSSAAWKCVGGRAGGLSGGVSSEHSTGSGAAGSAEPGASDAWRRAAGRADAVRAVPVRLVVSRARSSFCRGEAAHWNGGRGTDSRARHGGVHGGNDANAGGA